MRPLVTCCQRIWCLKNCLGLGSLTQMDVPKHINALIFMSNAFSKARLINLPICESMKCFYKNVLQKLIWCKSQRCIHFQATLLFAMASVAAIISSVIHSSEVFEPFAVFVCVLCLCMEREIPRGWDNGFQCGEETLKPRYDTTNPTYLEWKWNFVCANLLLRSQHQDGVNHIIKCYFYAFCGELELKA